MGGVQGAMTTRAAVDGRLCIHWLTHRLNWALQLPEVKENKEGSTFQFSTLSPVCQKAEWSMWTRCLVGPEDGHLWASPGRKKPTNLKGSYESDPTDSKALLSFQIQILENFPTIIEENLRISWKIVQNRHQIPKSNHIHDDFFPAYLLSIH